MNNINEAIAEITSANHDNAEHGERDIRILRDFQHLEYGTKLYAHPAQCLNQIQEPSAAEQAAWHAGLDEGRAQATGSVSNATSQAAPAAVNPSETPNSSTIAVPSGWKLVPDDATPEWVENLEALPDWRDAVGECIKKFLAASPVAPQAAPAAVAVPEKLPTGDVIRAIARSVSTSSSDSPSSSEYVMAGYRAALAATPAAAPVIPSELIEAVDAWFAQNTGLGGCSDKDVAELAAIFAAATPVTLPEPATWTLQSELDAKRTTTNGHLWFSNPVNALWTALYTEQQVRALLAQAAIAAAPAHHAEGAQTDLHAAIMNIPVNKAKLEHLGINERLQYKIGHRDARHDAAELAVAHAPPQAQADARDARDFWGVIAPCGEGVFFSEEADARWTQTGEGTGSYGFGVPTIGEAFRESYEDDKLELVRVHIAAIAAAKGEKQ